MKANELMIGDWVVNPVHKDKRKIEGVYYDKDLSCLVATDGRFPQEYFEPIPLTAEVLEKNGFSYDSAFWCFPLPKYQGMACLVAYYDEYDERVAEEVRGHWVFDENYITDYVHELQHDLRLCGLNDLADNFKIK